MTPGGAAVLVRGLALVLGLAFAGEALARCEDYVPQQRPQNVARDIRGASLDDIQERGWIEIALYEDFPPWSYEEGGEAKGVDVEIARLIAEDLGVEPRLKFVQADETLDADLRNWIWRGPIAGGRVANVMLHVPYDSELTCRIEQVVFTGLYHEEAVAIAYDAAHYADAAPTPAFFRFDPVGVENNTLSDFYLTSLGRGALNGTIDRFPTTEAAMDALAEGEVRAVMGPLSKLEAAAGEGVAVHQPPLPGLSRGSWPIGAAVHHAWRPLGYAVGDAITAGLQDGRIAAIFEAHGLTLSVPEW